MLLLINILSYTVSVSAIGILLPLYVYPGTSAAAWSPIAKVINAYPNVQWQIIINPQTGPGTNSSNPYPNDDYIAGIQSLDKWSNVKMLGYVDTAFGNRDSDDVKSDIGNYATWSTYDGGDISMDGIFFDDVPSEYDFHTRPTTQSTNETYFKAISSYAYSTFSNSSNATVVFNSGDPGASSFFDYCDTMIEFENTYAIYNGTSTLRSIASDGGNLSKSAIITYLVPRDLTAVSLMNMVMAMSEKDVKLVGLTNDCCYGALNGTLLNLVAAACNSTGSTSGAVAEAAASRTVGTSELKLVYLVGLVVALLAPHTFG